MSGPPGRAGTRRVTWLVAPLCALAVVLTWSIPVVAAQDGDEPADQDTSVVAEDPFTEDPAGTEPAAGAGPALPAGPVVQIASVSPWVAAEGEFQVRFRPGSSIPAGAQLTVTIHETLSASDDSSLRSEVNDIIEGGSAGRILQAPVTVPFEELGDAASGAVLAIPIRSTRGDPGRVFLPNPGIHPVDLVLTGPEGPELWSQTVFLNRLLFDAEDNPAPVRVTLVLPVQSGPAVGTDGSGTFTVEERAQLSSVTSLLESVPEAPMTLAVRPNTLDGLARTTEPWAGDLLESLGAARRSNVVLRMPYVPVDAAALVAAGESGQLEQQLLVGVGTVGQRTGRTTSPTTWVLDRSVSTLALPLLEGLGVDSLIVGADALRLPPELDEDQVMSSPVRLEGAESVQALAFDSIVSQRLADSRVDPGLRAHEGVSLMLAGWFSSTRRRDPLPLATAILVTPSTGPEVIAALTAALGGTGPLIAQPDAGALPAATEDTPTAALVPRTPPSVREAVAATDQTRREIASYRSMTNDADPASRLWDELANQSMASELTAEAREEMHASVRTAIRTQVDRIQAPRPRRVLVTSEDTVIPLRFRNDLPYEVRLVMRARSPRLEISEPTTEVVLAPGENRIELPVVVRAPGESLLRISLTSPDGGITVPSADVPVRSTAISGVGAVLSVLSILFLIGWWLRTLRRTRRDAARINHPGGSPATPTDAVSADRLGTGG